jgi:heterotetrameric sarcosine oxidase gamma subunit
MVEYPSARIPLLEELQCPLVQCEAWDGTLAALEAALAPQLGGTLPEKIGAIASYADWDAVRVALRRFWLFPRQPHPVPSVAVSPELGCSLDLGEGRVRIRIAAPNLREIISTCLAIDWDATKDLAVFSSFHRIPVMFTRSSDSEGQLVVPRSFSRSISGWLGMDR